MRKSFFEKKFKDHNLCVTQACEEKRGLAQVAATTEAGKSYE